MKTVRLKDRNFEGGITSRKHGACDAFRWDRTRRRGLTVYTDAYLTDRVLRRSGPKIAWLLEPAAIDPRPYAWIRQHHRRFLQVWTHDEALGVPNARWVPQAGTWIAPGDRAVHRKTRLCSFIASSKATAPGHRLRQEARARLPATVDAYGHGFVELAEKVDGLREHAFSIAIENCRVDTYFSEKLVDCFLTGTVPVYWGSREVARHFDAAGILAFDTVDELLDVVAGLDLDAYERMLPAVRRNFERAKAFTCAENVAAPYLDEIGGAGPFRWLRARRGGAGAPTAR